MARNESKSYDSSIFEKANAPLASKLRELISSEKTKELADYIGVSVQAVNQYKQGTAYPKTENLFKIADFCNCSVDYLLGIAELPTRNTTVQGIHEYTGLSEAAIGALHGSLSEIACGVRQVSIPVREREVVNALLESKAGRKALDYIYSFLFTSFDRFQMGEQERDYVTMIGDTLPAYIVRPEDVLEVFVLRMNQCLTELKKEVDDNGKH